MINRKLATIIKDRTPLLPAKLDRGDEEDRPWESIR
jgi:hypothetical protein